MRWSRVRSVIAALVALTLVLLAPAPSAPARGSSERAAATVRLVGNGYGHGHGLSQWGAQRAAEQGVGHRKILAFYYPGLKRGRAGGDVSVLISGDTSTDVVVVARPGLRVRSLGSGTTFRLDKPAARLWRLTPSSRGSRTAVAWKAGSGGWRAYRVVPGEAEFSAGGQPVTLVTPSERRAYRGVLRSARPTASSGKRDTVNVLPLDSYLRGVVPREVYTSWKPAALRAQAVAARTYAAFDRGDGNAAAHYEICDTTSCQVYGGASSEVASTDRAIADTRGEILTKGGKPAFTQFSASNGGWMSAGSQPYLVSKQDPFDDTYRGWTDSIAPREFERAFPAIGAFRRIEVLERDGNGQWGGRVTSVKIVGAATSTTISGETFRLYFGLNSTWFQEVR